jgi:Zn-dependent protease with chaperone function
MPVAALQSRPDTPFAHALRFFETLPRENIDAALRAVRTGSISPTERDRIRATLPLSGELVPTEAERRKLDALQAVLLYHERLQVLDVKVIDVRAALVALHRRAVLLISRSALDLLSAPELQAAVAHEIGHDFLWGEFVQVQRTQDRRARHQLELQCDGIAALTLLALTQDPMHLPAALKKLRRFNARLGPAADANDYPTLRDRERLVSALISNQRPNPASVVADVPPHAAKSTTPVGVRPFAMAQDRRKVDHSTGIEQPDERVMKPVLALLLKRPALVALVDAEAARPDVRRQLLKLDAFVLKGQPGVYLVKQSAVYQGAQKGSTVHQLILASIIWHEMAHLEGADEQEAQRREEELWTRFVRDQQVDSLTGVRYLNLLKKRHWRTHVTTPAGFESPQDSDPPTPRIRPIDKAAVALLKEGLRRSPSIRTLAAEIEKSDVTVYVIASNDAGTWRGVTRFMAARGGERFLAVTINMAQPQRERLAVLGHELQHVREVAAAPEVVDHSSMRRLFLRLSDKTSPSAEGYETDAAQSIERDVRNELSQHR